MKWENGSASEKPREELESLFWDDTSPEKFTSILGDYEQEISEIISDPNVNALESFQSLIKNVIKKGNFKKKNKKVSDDAPWFDKDCKIAKDEIKKVGSDIKNRPTDPSLRKILTDKKKDFRKITREKEELRENDF
jgi:hypothetical protein